jgi:hypothetical protein
LADLPPLIGGIGCGFGGGGGLFPLQPHDIINSI